MRFNADFLPSKTDSWSTPYDLYNFFMEKGFLDPCPLDSTFNGLALNYSHKRLFVNPPFSDLSTWVDWCIKQFHNRCMVIILMPSRTDTKYFQKLLECSPSIWFFAGRLKFGGSDKCAPFPTLLVTLIPSIINVPFYQYGSIDKFIKCNENL